MSLVNIEGYSQYKKDTTTGGVVNVDSKSFEQYKFQKRVAIQKRVEHQNTVESVTVLQNEINSLKGDLSEIKQILVQLMEKGKQ
jgi:hypothetical protein